MQIDNNNPITCDFYFRIEGDYFNGFLDSNFELLKLNSLLNISFQHTLRCF